MTRPPAGQPGTQRAATRAAATRAAAMQSGGAPPATAGPREIAVALLLFLIWSNTFVAISYLLGAESAAARFGWLDLAVARFLPAAPLSALYAFAFHRRQALAAIRRHGARLLVCGLLAVPAYNSALYYGQQHGVPAPVASVTTVLAPLFIMVLARLVLGEPLTRRRIAGFAVALAGILLIAGSRPAAAGIAAELAGGHAVTVAITALAPLSWAVYSVLSKPASADVPPLLWTSLTVTVGTAPLLLIAPWHGGPQLLRLDLPGWLALLYLSLLGTLLGYALWNWLLERLPASTVGLTVFLNPPLTTLSKALLALLLPAVFTFQLVTGEWVGGGLILAGLWVAMARRSRRTLDRRDGAG